MKKYVISAVVVLVLIGCFVVLNKNNRLGGGLVSDAYSYRAVTSTDASATVPVQVRGGAGVLGSITVGTTHATVVRVYDGTTATSTGTLIATLAASVGQQTLNFDVATKQGIVLDVPAGFAGIYTVTYK